MPAQKRPLPPSAPEDHLQKQHRHASGDGGGEGGGGEATTPADMEQIHRAEEEVEVKVEEENGEKVAAMAEEEAEAQEEGEEEEEVEEEEGEDKVEVKEKQEPVLQRCDEQAGSDDEDSGIPSSSSVKDEYIHVKLADIRKEVQCPICLGIIRKTRTVMECLHRFCRECIDKSMRLGNNECPACRTHCASRRSLRDDPRYDALIAALYPDIDKYEEEELAFHEEENNRNKKIQASIAEILRRQIEALGKRRPTTRNAGRKSVNFRRGRNRNFSRDTIQGSDYEDEDAEANDVGKDSSSADEHFTEARPKKFTRRLGPRLSPALGTSSADGGCDENDDGGGKEMRVASPALVGNREVLVWGKGGARSQTRHGSGTNGKNAKGNRITRLVDYLRNSDEKENEYDMHLTLLPLDKETVPSLERPYLCCRPTLSIKHICQFIAHETSTHAEEIEILVKKPQTDASASVNCRNPNGQANTLEDELQVLEAQESLSGLHAFFPSNPGNLVLVYRAKN